MLCYRARREVKNLVALRDHMICNLVARMVPNIFTNRKPRKKHVFSITSVFIHSHHIKSKLQENEHVKCKGLIFCVQPRFYTSRDGVESGINTEISELLLPVPDWNIIYCLLIHCTNKMQWVAFLCSSQIPYWCNCCVESGMNTESPLWLPEISWSCHSSLLWCFHWIVWFGVERIDC